MVVKYFVGAGRIGGGGRVVANGHGGIVWKPTHVESWSSKMKIITC